MCDILSADRRSQRHGDIPLINTAIYSQNAIRANALPATPPTPTPTLTHTHVLTDADAHTHTWARMRMRGQSPVGALINIS